jgi:hypothetical protein
MTDWPFGSQHTMTHPPKCSQTPKQAEHNMDPQTLQSKMHEEIAKFQKTMEEFHLLKAVSQDLKKYRTMTALKKFD